MNKGIMNAAKQIVDCLYCDSGITLDVNEIYGILEGDIKAMDSGIPTREEIEQLVMGDDDGQIPDRLNTMYPDTSTILSELF